MSYIYLLQIDSDDSRHSWFAQFLFTKRHSHSCVIVYILIAIFFRLLSTCLPAIVALVLHVFLSPLAFAIMCKNDSYDFPLALWITSLILIVIIFLWTLLYDMHMLMVFPLNCYVQAHHLCRFGSEPEGHRKLCSGGCDYEEIQPSPCVESPWSLPRLQEGANGYFAFHG